MGLFSGLKRTSGIFVDFRIDRWLDLAFHKQTLSNIIKHAKGLYTIPNSEKRETFKDAVLRFELSDGELEAQANRYLSLTYLFLAVSFCIFIYALCLLLFYRNFPGFCVSLALVIFGLSNAFRNHFWYFQIKQEKLGCTFKEWWDHGFLKKPILENLSVSQEWIDKPERLDKALEQALQNHTNQKESTHQKESDHET